MMSRQQFDILHSRILRYGYRLRHSELTLSRQIRGNAERIATWFLANPDFELTMPNFSLVVRSLVPNPTIPDNLKGEILNIIYGAEWYFSIAGCPAAEYCEVDEFLLEKEDKVVETLVTTIVNSRW